MRDGCPLGAAQRSGSVRWAGPWLAAVVASLWARAGYAQGFAPEPSDPVHFESSVRGVNVGVGAGTSRVGDSLLGELGGRWEGIESLRAARWLLAWDISLGLRGGYLANEHPYLFLLGPSTRSFAEAGYRFEAGHDASPYAGLRLSNEVQWLAHPGRALAAFKTSNDVDGVGGALARGSMRADLGVSFLGPGRSLLLVAFVEEALQDRQVNAEALTLTEGGVAARLDLRRNLSASLEGAIGVSPERRDSLRSTRDRTTRLSTAASLLWAFANRSWLSARTSVARDADRLSYTGQRSYDTASPPVFSAEVGYGFSLERRRP
jgi:hypothetical protein